MKIKAVDFKNISIRGRLAYGICCLENALEYYGISGKGWTWYLRKLWWYTELATEADPTISNCYQAERWYSIVYDISPSYMRNEGISYDILVQKMQVLYKEDLPTEEEYLMLKDAYRQSNEVVEKIITNIFHIGCCELWCAIIGYSKQTMEYLQNVIDIMNKQKIPLPSMEPFNKYVFSKDGWDYDLYGFGEMFDGTIYSKFVNKEV